MIAGTSRRAPFFFLSAALCFFFAFFPPEVSAFEIPDKTEQLLVGKAYDWNSSYVSIQKWSRVSNGIWKKEDVAFSGRLGSKGLAWGRGLHPVENMDGPRKKEGDSRAPCGVFELGDTYGYAPAIEKSQAMKYHHVVEGDLWVEDPESPQYNRHVRLDRPPSTDWENAQQMRLNDPAHSLKLFIAHNAPPDVVPGMGSSIFFHVWRQGGGRPSAGCTTVSEMHLREIIRWLEPRTYPLYVLLPESVYKEVGSAWKLPQP